MHKVYSALLARPVFLHKNYVMEDVCHRLDNNEFFAWLEYSIANHQKEFYEYREAKRSH